jgi:hypothetical protein
MSFDSKEYWFKNKRYGMGWVPSGDIGWFVLFIHGISIIGIVVYAEETGLIQESPEKFLLLVVAIVLLLLAICWKTGEPLIWRWGKKK